ncbi:MAG: hypothetical protein HY056_08020, partial [Proteobacteria bacterium]|nr:hypothetical protein [Pseudomonadota bacterium]
RRERVEAARGDKAIRAVALTATAAWTMTRAGDTLTLRAKGATRVLARVEPGRLRRLRAAMLVSGLDAGRHWRCFLANATARDKAFAALGDGTRAAPAFLDSYLRAASYVATIDALSRQPTPDDPDAATRALIGHDSERLMVEDFEGLRLPASLGDKRRLMEIAAWIEHRLRPMPAAQGQPERARPPRVPLNDAELAALARDVNADAEMKQLFCVP